MPYLAAVVLTLFALWVAKRAVTRQLKRKVSPHPLPAMEYVARRPKHRPALYLIGGLLVFISGWLFRDAWFPGEQPKTHDSSDAKKEPDAPQYLTSAPPPAPVLSDSQPLTDGSCVWVDLFTRQDGTYVDSHWSSKPGRKCSLEEPEPPPKPHAKLSVHIGPRGGVYHISPKSGKKVYEHHHR